MPRRSFYSRSQDFISVDLEIKDNKTLEFRFRVDAAFPNKVPLPNFSSSIAYLNDGPGGRGQAPYYAHDNAFGFSYRVALGESDSLIRILNNTLCPLGIVKDAVIHWVEQELKKIKQNNPQVRVLVAQSVVASGRQQSNEGGVIKEASLVSKL